MFCELLYCICWTEIKQSNAMENGIFQNPLQSHSVEGRAGQKRPVVQGSEIKEALRQSKDVSTETFVMGSAWVFGVSRKTTFELHKFGTSSKQKRAIDFQVVYSNTFLLGKIRP